MKNNPLVSIIIPAYNEERYIGLCLKSILSQLYPNFEVIFIDDGSKDKTRQIASNFKGIKIFYQNHKGSGAARNLGARKAKGKILVFADADMTFDKNYISNLIKPILEGKTIGTFTKEEYIANTDNIWARCWNINTNLPINRHLPEDYPNEETSFRAILKDKFMSVGGFDGKGGYTDDQTVAQKLNRKAVLAPDAICYHFNPDTLIEVFYSARWIGRSPSFFRTVRNLFRYSFLNSLRLGIKKVIKGVDIRFILFKLVFDFGIFIGILTKGQKIAK